MIWVDFMKRARGMSLQLGAIHCGHFPFIGSSGIGANTMASNTYTQATDTILVIIVLNTDLLSSVYMHFIYIENSILFKSSK